MGNPCELLLLSAVLPGSRGSWDRMGRKERSEIAQCPRPLWISHPGALHSWGHLGNVEKVPEGPKVIGMVLKMTFTCFLIVHVVSLYFFYPSRFSESFARRSESVSGTSICQEGTLTPSTLCPPWCSPATAQSSPSSWRTLPPSPHHKAKGRTEDGAKESPLSCHTQVTKISAGQQGMPCAIYLHLQRHF